MIHFTEEPTLKDYLAACRRRAWVVVVVLCLVSLVGVKLAFLTTALYRAQATVLVDLSTWNTRDYVERADVPEVARVLETLAARVLSAESLAELGHRRNLFPALEGDADRIAATTRSAISTEVTGFDQFRVRFVHPDPVVAAEVANELAEAFVAEQRRLRVTHGENTTAVMAHTLAQAARKLAEQGDAIKQYRILHQGSLPGQTDGNLRAIERWHGDLRLNTQSLQRAKQRLALALASTPRIYHGEAIEALRAEVFGLEAERAELRRLIADAEVKVARAAEVEGTLAAMQREQDSTLRAYNELLTQRQNASLRVELDRSRFDSLFRVVEPAKVPASPFKPARAVILAITVALGLLGGAALAIAVDWFDDTFHAAPELARVTGYPVLATVTRIPRLPAGAALDGGSTGST